MEIAQDLAMELGHKYIGTEHLLYGILEVQEGLAYKLLAEEVIENT